MDAECKLGRETKRFTFKGDISLIFAFIQFGFNFELFNWRQILKC